ASAARLFSRKGYRVALISRGPEPLNKLAIELNERGGEVGSHFLGNLLHYSPSSVRSAFASIRSHFPAASSPLRVALFNAGHGVWKPFLEVTDEDVRDSLDIVAAAFAFSREVITEFLKLGFEDSSEGGQGGARKRGTLLFTGATASTRGNATTSAFAAGKHGLRALAQSLAKEFGKQNIHVAHSYLSLVQQDSSALTWEIDLRPAHEKW
ncbi:hypothetical protein ID866_8695, partial [Astraeus odoratus]